MMYKWRYDGPVMEFNTCVCNRWTGETVATSEARAKSNLVFQFKKQNNKCARTVVSMPGKLIRIMRKEG